MSRIPVTLIPGDGIGPEVVAAARRLVDATGAPIDWELAEAGAEVFKKGVASGVPRETLESLRRTGLALKGPLETPVGYGEKSANVTLRKAFETYGNVRPVRELPGVQTPFSGRGIDLVIVRENVEDLYAGIEHQQSPGVAQCLKLISRKGCEKIIRLAFELAKAEGRQSVSCATKANIMKLTEGLMKKVFEEVALDYPQIRAEHLLVDNCAHQMVIRPEAFEVIVTTNMNGDILSDLASGLCGGLGFAPSSNLGHGIAIFEAVHGSAPQLAGQGKANPTALILTACLMLRHAGLGEQGALLENALLAVLEEGKVRTGDFQSQGRAASTTEFTEAVLAAFGRTPTINPARPTGAALRLQASGKSFPAPAQRGESGVDVFVETQENPQVLGPKLEVAVHGSGFQLKMLSNRGTKVYPGDDARPDLIDVYRCRLIWTAGPVDSLPEDSVLNLLARVGARWRWMHVEKLLTLNGQAAYTRAQGED